MVTNCGCGYASASSTNQCRRCPAVMRSYPSPKVKSAHTIVKVPCLRCSSLFKPCTSPQESTNSLQRTCIFTCVVWVCSSELRLRRSELPCIDFPFNRTYILGCQVSDSKRFSFFGFALSGGQSHTLLREALAFNIKKLKNPYP